MLLWLSKRSSAVALASLNYGHFTGVVSAFAWVQHFFNCVIMIGRPFPGIGKIDARHYVDCFVYPNVHVGILINRFKIVSVKNLNGNHDIWIVAKSKSLS